LTTAAVALFAVAASIPEAQATRVTLDGVGYRTLSTSYRYYRYAPEQTGRYESLGADYYRNAEIGIRRITNRGTRRSGSMSFELWAMPYYGATSGIVLMTNGVDPLRAGFRYNDVAGIGKAVFLDRRRFPELDLFEYTSNGWKWRDALTFSNSTRL
jgi:hypothetical protein